LRSKVEVLRRSIVRRFMLALALTLAAYTANAQGPKPPSSLPSIDWQCYASFTISFASPGSKFHELGLDGDNLKKPHLELHVIHNQIFKVIENPTIPELRKEYAVELFNMTQDFSRRNPVYAWREEQGFQVKVYAFNVNDRILSRTTVLKPDAPSLDQNEVFVCRSSGEAK
jgi:hypothetical protein